LRRRVSKDGRSRAYINGTPVNLPLIRELGEMLIDIHGQHEHQSLMKTQTQRQLLDDYANHKSSLEKLRTIFSQWKQTSTEYKQLRDASNERNDRIDLLRYQVEELNELSLVPGEYKTLDEEHHRLANSDKLMDTCQNTLQTLYETDDNNLYSQLSRQAAQIEALSETDHKLSPANTMLTEAMVQIEETASLLRDYLSHLENDPKRLSEVEQRLNSILDLSRKHRVEPEQLHEIHEQLSRELDNLDHADENLSSLEKQTTELRKKYIEQAGKLGQ